MRPASAKSKGRRLQQRIASDILAAFPQLTADDVKSTPMGCVGEDVQLSAAARVCFPFSIEAKNTEKLNVWSALSQAEDAKRARDAVLVFKRNRSEVYAALRWETLLALLSAGSPRAGIASSDAAAEEIDQVVRRLQLVRDSLVRGRDGGAALPSEAGQVNPADHPAGN